MQFRFFFIILQRVHIVIQYRVFKFLFFSQKFSALFSVSRTRFGDNPASNLRTVSRIWYIWIRLTIGLLGPRTRSCKDCFK